MKPSVEVSLSTAPKNDVKQYAVLKKLAVGGMAEIYLARASGMGGFHKYVVLKRILPNYANDECFISMFLDEARLSALFQHQNIAQVHDIGQAGGSYFFTMEYLHGENLRCLMAKLQEVKRKLPLACALTLISGAAAGLHYAHEKRGPNGKNLNVVHRDVSPSNIIATFDGGVKLVDFGVARASANSTETQTGSLKGKISYMSPEQCRGSRISRRSDIFSLGIVLYELTTNSRLFGGRPNISDYAVMNQIVDGLIPPPRQISPDYPPELEPIVLRALANDPEERYQTAREFLTELEAFAANSRLPLSNSALAVFMEEIYSYIPEPWHDNLEEEPDEENVTAAPPVTQSKSVSLSSKVSESTANVDENQEFPTIIGPASWSSKDSEAAQPAPALVPAISASNTLESNSSPALQPNQGQDQNKDNLEILDFDNVPIENGGRTTGKITSEDLHTYDTYEVTETAHPLQRHRLAITVGAVLSVLVGGIVVWQLSTPSQPKGNDSTDPASPATQPTNTVQAAPPSPSQATTPTHLAPAAGDAPPTSAEQPSQVLPEIDHQESNIIYLNDDSVPTGEEFAGTKPQDSTTPSQTPPQEPKRKVSASPRKTRSTIKRGKRKRKNKPKSFARKVTPKKTTPKKTAPAPKKDLADKARDNLDLDW